MNHKYDYSFVSTNKVESLHVLTTAVKIGLDGANRQQRSRLVRPSEVSQEFLTSMVQEGHGHYHINGGGVANRYGYQATSTVLDVFCWTDMGGVLHCRILADRVRCHGKTVRGAKLQKHLIQNIYPDLEFSILVKDYKALPKQFQPLVHELIGHPERAINWFALADLMQKEGIYSIRADRNRGGFHNIDSVRETGRFANARICQGALETV